jgi:hypothetical protein
VSSQEYVVSFVSVMQGTVFTFDQEPFRRSLALYISEQSGTIVVGEDIELVISAASVRVVSSIRTSGSTDAEMIASSINAATPAALGASLSAISSSSFTFESISPPTVYTVLVDDGPQGGEQVSFKSLLTPHLSDPEFLILAFTLPLSTRNRIIAGLLSPQCPL